MENDTLRNNPCPAGSACRNYVLSCAACKNRKLFHAYSGQSYAEYACEKQSAYLTAIRSFLMITAYSLNLPTHTSDTEQLTRNVRMYQWGNLLTEHTASVEEVVDGVPTYGIFSVLSQLYIMLRNWLEKHSAELPARDMSKEYALDQFTMAQGVQELLDVIATRRSATELEQAPASFDIALLVKALNNW